MPRRNQNFHSELEELLVAAAVAALEAATRSRDKRGR